MSQVSGSNSENSLSVGTKTRKIEFVPEILSEKVIVKIDDGCLAREVFD